MLKHFLITALLSLLACMGVAQPAADTPIVLENSLLWKISGNGMTKPSYLFGTIHIICKKDFLWTSKMANSLKSSDEVCMEMDMDDPTILLEIASGMIDPSGKSLKDYFTPEDFALVERYFMDSVGININTFNTMKPVVLQTMLSTNVTDCDSLAYYEVKITEDAKKLNKEITGLETAKEQLALLDKIPVDSIISELVKTAKGQGDTSIEIKSMIAAYKKQDLNKLYDFILKSKDAETDMNAFLDERNEKWIDRMAEHMDQRSVFFAVGAGHLGGRNGLINLLRQRGYMVTAVK